MIETQSRSRERRFPCRIRGVCSRNLPSRAPFGRAALLTQEGVVLRPSLVCFRTLLPDHFFQGQCEGIVRMCGKDFIERHHCLCLIPSFK